MKRLVILLLVLVVSAVPLFAQSSHQRIMMPTPITGMNTMALELASDGTVITTRTVAGSSMDNSLSQEVVAISPAGTVAWSWKADQPINYLFVTGNTVIAVMSSMQYMGGTLNSTSRVTALAVSNGSKSWETQIDGMIMKVDATSNAIYALSTKGMMALGVPTSMMGGGFVDARTLYAISASNGTVLWKVALSPNS